MKRVPVLSILTLALAASIASPAQTISKVATMGDERPPQETAIIYRIPKTMFLAPFQVASMRASQFGIHGSPKLEEDGASIKEGDRQLFIKAGTGEIHFSLTPPAKRNPRTTMSVDAHKPIAIAFLKQAGYSESEFFLENTAEHHAGTATSPDTVEDVVYHFRRIVDGLPAYGPGTSLHVTVGKEGQVRLADLDWHALLMHEGAMIESPSQRKQEARNRLQAIRSHAADRGLTLVAPEKVKLVYFSQSDGDGGYTLVPAYMSVCEATSKERQGTSYVTVFHTASGAHPLSRTSTGPMANRTEISLPSPVR